VAIVESGRLYHFGAKTMSDQQTQNAKPPADLSPRIVQLARQIDHLPAGQYTIALVKAPAPQAWRVEISQVVSVRVVDTPLK
jgi:hypothetical protein